MWESLRQASYKGVLFDFEDVGDDYTKSLAKYEYPYRDNPDVEDLGTATEVKLKVWFLNDRYAAHTEFLAKVKEPGPGELIHPIYGSMTAIAQTCSSRHDDRDMTAEMDVSFLVVSYVPAIVSMPTLKSKGAEVAALGVEADAIEEDLLASSFKALGIPEAAPVEGLGESGYLATVSGLTASARKELGAVSGYVGKTVGYIIPYVNSLSLIASTVAIGVGLPVAVMGQVTGVINSTSGSLLGLLGMPGKFIGGLSVAMLGMEMAFGGIYVPIGIQAVYKSRKARALVSAAALELRADEAAEKDAPLSLKDYGQPDAEVSRGQVMTVDEIDAVVGGARESVNDALSGIRDTFGDRGYGLELNLKAQAALLQEMADDIRLHRPRIVEHQVQGETSLHLLCFKLYGDITRASEIMRLNRIKDPNFLKAGETLRVYAA